MKKISIIMAVFNCRETVAEAIDSILVQTYQAWELIICDDCSTDDTYEIVQGYQKRYPEKIILIRNKRNEKLASSLNHCLSLAAGEYVARMDGDDISLPERLEKQIAYLEGHPEHMVVGCSMIRFNEQGECGLLKARERPEPYDLVKGVPFAHATIVMRKNAYDLLHGYVVSKRTVRAQDRDLWFRFYARHLSGANLAEPLYKVREDIQTVRRRTLKARFYEVQTALIGYHMLHFPLRFYPFAFIPLLKALVPKRLILRRHTRKEYMSSHMMKGVSS